MWYVHGSVALLLFVCIATTVDAQVKCNPVSFTVTGGWCKDKTVSYKGCFDAAAADTDKSSKAAFIAANQASFTTYSQAMCLAGATSLCAAVGGKPKDWDCKDVNNECSSDNLPNNFGAGACSTDAQCTAFAKSTMKICCDVIKKYMTDLICDNADKTKIDALYVDGLQCSSVATDKDCRKANGSSSSRASILNTLAVGAMTAVLATMTAL